jgi:serine/threonine protein kinase
MTIRLLLYYIYRVDESGVVKVADFGMAKDVYESNYYKISDQHGPQPVRWMAVESLEDNQFSAKSDVVSRLHNNMPLKLKCIYCTYRTSALVLAVGSCLSNSEFKHDCCVHQWSFGVLMWEVMTRGKTPYWGIENFDIKRAIVMGRRLEHPPGASDFVYVA